VATIRIQDTLSGETRELQPREPGKVGIYACGPTVYGRIHIGNARPYVIFTLLKRFLEHQGLEATLVINVTDINDKIYDAAREAGKLSDQYAAEMTAAPRDTDALGWPA
jgi:cysteinyl-tRNA synthetase